MGLGTSQGAYYDDAFHQAAAEWDPKYDTNEIAPQAIQDATDNPPPVTKASDTGTGPVKVYITGSDSAGTSTSTPNSPAYYDTQLTPEQQTQYSGKFDKNASQDYDMQGYFAANPDVEPNAPGVHYPDTFKKPNHMTFSDESQYHGIDGNQGGHWGTDENGKDTFTPGPTNLQQHTPQELQDYFKKVEPDVKLIMPDSSSSNSSPQSYGGPSILHAVQGMMNPSFDEDKQILSGFYDTVKNAFKLPGDVYGGKIDPTSPQGIERAADLAGLMVMGPAPVAGKMADGTLGSFMGVQSKTFDKNALAEAQVMKANGAHPDEIWQKTGTTQGPEGRWKQEIDDSKSKINPSVFDKPAITEKKTSGPFEQVPFEPSKGMVGAKLPELLDHPELYKAYPWLQNMKVFKNPYHNPNGAFYRAPNEIHLGVNVAENKDQGILLHEIQHAIQDREGFAQGGSPADKFSLRFDSDLDKTRRELIGIQKRLQDGGKVTDADLTKIDKATKLFELDRLRRIAGVRKAQENYVRLAGEVEARNVDTRMLMDEIHRRLVPPTATEDVPRAQQLISDKPMWTTPYGMTDNPMRPLPNSIPGEFTPYSKRWSNNDNIRPLNEHEQFIKDYDELHAFGQRMNKNSDIDVHKYNKMGRAMMKKMGEVWTDVPLGRLEDR